MGFGDHFAGGRDLSEACVSTDVHQLVDGEVARLRFLAFDQLLRFMKPLHTTVHSDKGDEYDLEVQSFWDDRDEQNLRVVVSAFRRGRDRKRWMPQRADAVASFIVASDGRFIGE